MPSVNLFDIIREIVAEQVEDFGREVVEERRTELSVPVTYAVGPRGGRRPIPSKRGEKPRARTGGLARAVSGEFNSFADYCQFVVAVDHPGAVRLQETLGRVILNDLPDAKAEQFLSRIANAIQNEV